MFDFKKMKFGTREGLIMAFVLPVLVLTYVFIGSMIYPFGKFCYLRTDLYHQYAPFFVEFKNKLSDGTGMLYSHHVGLGINFVALYAYYLASPLNWLVKLCPEAHVIEFITIMVLLKTGLAGLSFAYYLVKHRNPDQADFDDDFSWDSLSLDEPEHGFGICLFGAFYALSGYMAAYSWNIMWLDCIVLFPMIMLGVERLITEKKSILYCVTLGLCILTNYYISIMICIFLVVYFFAVYFLKEEKGIVDFFTAGIRFGFYSLVAGGMAAIVLLPEIAALKMTASGEFSFPKKFENYFSIFDMLARHIGNVQTEQGLDHWPNIYCGAAVFIMIALYIACKRISAKEKAVYFSMLFFLLMSFAINVLNFIWHGFHYPNSLPARQSFIYIFLVLFMCYRAYQYLYQTRPSLIIRTMWGSIALIILMQKLVTEDHFHPVVFYIAIVVVALYGGLLWKARIKAYKPFTTGALAVALVMLELTVNTAVTGISVQNRANYLNGIFETRNLLQEATEGMGFYRVRKNSYRTKNDGALEQYNTASLFSSMANADVTELYTKLGLTGSTNSYGTDGATPFTDMLLGINFIVSEEAMDDGYLIYRGEENGWHLYENPYVLPLGYIVPDIMEDSWKLSKRDALMSQDNLTTLFDIDPVLEVVNGYNSSGSFSFTAEEDGCYYIDMGSHAKSVEVEVGSDKKSYDNVDRGYLIPTGFISAGTSVSVTGEGDLEGRAAIFRPEHLKEMYEILAENTCTVTNGAGDYSRNNRSDVIKASVDGGANGGSLMFTIPYDESWTVYVDGKKCESRKILDTFLCVEIQGGHHEIELKFYPKGFKPGMAVTAVSVMIFLAAVIAEVMYKKKSVQ